MVNKCNEQFELSDNLCDLQCPFSDAMIDSLEYYEKRCPDVAYNMSMMSNDEMLMELNKYGIYPQDREVCD